MMKRVNGLQGSGGRWGWVWIVLVVGCVGLVSAKCGPAVGGGGGGDGGYYTEPAPKVDQSAPANGLPSVAAQLRDGHWLHGANFPWDNYGGDFGKNGWGYRGLANQGPGGARFETKAPNDGARGFFWAEYGAGNHCLGVKVSLPGPDAGAVVYFRFDEPAGRALDSTLDLSGQTVSVRIYLPARLMGSEHSPNGVMIFFQDDDWTWAQTPWRNIGTGDVDHWVKLTANLNTLETPEGGIFEAAKVRTAGIKVGVNSRAAGYSFNGDFYIDDLRASGAPPVQFGFDAPDTRSELEMKTVAALGTTAQRLWLFADGRAGLVFNDDGTVAGLDDRFMGDLDEALRLARESHQYLVITLFDYLLGAEAQVVDGVTIYGRADLINDPVKRASLINNAVGPVLDRLAGGDETVALDLMNEPEWLILDADITMPAGSRPGIVKPGGVISLATMRQFFAEIIALHQGKHLTAKQLLTVGSASPRWVTLWSGLGLDLNQFHFWNGAGQIDDGLTLNFAPPVAGVPTIIGEVGSGNDLCAFLDSAHTLGYTGVFPWSYRAKDGVAPLELGAAARDCMSEFAANHPLEVGF